MNTDELQVAYDAVLAAATGATFRPPPGGGWDAAMILAHLVVNDGLLLAATGEVLAGHSPTYDNSAAIDVDRLSRVAADAGGVDQLLDQLRGTSSQMIELASKLDDGQGATMIPTRIVDGGTVQVDQPIPLAALFRAQTAIHLPSHCSQLAQLATTSPAS